MLVSHKHKFIYIKNYKAASESTEFVFQKFCYADGTEFTPQLSVPPGYADYQVLGPSHTKHGVASGRHYHAISPEMVRLELTDYFPDEAHTLLRTSTRRHYSWYQINNITVHPHMSAVDIRSAIGSKLFEQYFKFCVVRNPWDKMVSYFWWSAGSSSRDSLFADFNKWCKKEEITKTSLDWDLYTINNVPVCDYYIKFEDLRSGIKEVADKLKIDFNSLEELPHFHNSHRRDELPLFNNSHWRANKRPYWEYYNDESREIIAKAYCKEIDYFGYKFGE